MGFKDGLPKKVMDASNDDCDFRSLGEFWFSQIPKHLRECLTEEVDLSDVLAPVFLNRRCDRVIIPARYTMATQQFVARGVLPPWARGTAEDDARFVFRAGSLFLERIPDLKDVSQSNAAAEETSHPRSVDRSSPSTATFGRRESSSPLKKDAHGCVFPLELSTRLKERSKDMGDDAGGRGYHQRVLDAVIDEFLDSGGFFPVQCYSQYLNAIIDYCEDGVGVENHFDPFRVERFEGRNSSELFVADHPVEIFLWTPEQIDAEFRLKSDEEVIEFVGPAVRAQDANEGGTRATRFVFPTEKHGVEVYLYGECDDGSSVRVQPHFLSLRPGESIGDLSVEHLKTAIFYGHDLPFFSSIQISTKANGCALADNVSLLASTTDLSFRVKILRETSEEPIVVTFDDRRLGREYSISYGNVDAFVLRNLDRMIGRKLFVFSERHSESKGWHSRFGNSEKAMGEPCIPEFDSENSQSVVAAWVCTTLAQDGAGISWMFADPDSDTDVGRRNRKNVDNFVAHLRRRIKEEEAEGKGTTTARAP